MKPTRTLLFSTLYPSSARPGHGIFVETRLRELLREPGIETRVVAPVPWFFSAHPRWGRYAAMARTPCREFRHGIDVLHPRYLLPPKAGMNVAPLSLAVAAVPALRTLRAEGFDFDVIDAHYYYPDGVAAALLARWFRRPLVITARGSDLNLLARYRLPRRMMRWAAGRAEASAGVCGSLTQVLLDWGIPPGRLHVLRNGVDLERFRPLPQGEMRERLGIGSGPVLLSVGHLVELKGHHLAIEALARLVPAHPGMRLAIVGEGGERARLENLARRLGVSERVRFAGAIDHAQLAPWYSAADLLLLASSREGWANVLLEAMACGTPVVATRIGGTPEVVKDPGVGELIERRDAPSLAEGVCRMLERRPDRAQVRRYAEGFGWRPTSRAQLELFRRLAGSADPHA